MERKITTPFIIVGLAVAFAAVSAWVWLSGGKNARAVRTKFKIGGLLLTLTTAVATQSCRYFATSCYDPGPTPMDPECELYDEDMKLANGDTLRLYASGYNSPYYSFEIIDKDNNSLQKGMLYSIEPLIVAVGDYAGPAKVNVYGENKWGVIAQENHIKSFDITIEAVATLPEDTTEEEENTDNVE